jgi:hypothetical protein
MEANLKRKMVTRAKRRGFQKGAMKSISSTEQSNMIRTQSVSVHTMKRMTKTLSLAYLALKACKALSYFFGSFHYM